MKSKKETFAGMIKSFRYKYDLATVFDDFLTLSLCSVTQNPKTKVSHYEELYLETIKKYKDDPLRFQFPNMFSALVLEMGEGLNSTECMDVLGNYYQLQCAKKGLSQFFTPWPICQMMAKMTIEAVDKTEDRPLRILEPACGSGRMILAAAKEAGLNHEFYGIDVDATCVKMTALNLFLHGVFHAEVMCGDALMPDDFRFSYLISIVPLGVFRIEEKEKSRLWHLMQNALKANQKQKPAIDIKLPSESGEAHSTDAKQASLF